MRFMIGLIVGVVLTFAGQALAGGGCCGTKGSCDGGECTCAGPQSATSKPMQYASADTKAEGIATKKEVVGNTICPVSGDKIGSMGPGVTVEHEGKIYNLCCEGCIDKFKAEPDKYSTMAEDSLEVEAVKPAGHEGHDHQH